MEGFRWTESKWNTERIQSGMETGLEGMMSRWVTIQGDSNKKARGSGRMTAVFEKDEEDQRCSWAKLEATKFPNMSRHSFRGIRHQESATEIEDNSTIALKQFSSRMTNEQRQHDIHG